MNQVFLLLGSNIEPEKNIPLAIDSLQKNPNSRVNKISSVWRTKAVGTPSDDFLNVAVEISTSCELHCLKELILCDIEYSMGRVRTEDKYAPRTIDLDVLIFNGLILDQDIFTLDHMILPLAELIPELYSAGYNNTLMERAKAIQANTKAKKLGRSISRGTIDP